MSLEEKQSGTPYGDAVEEFLNQQRNSEREQRGLISVRRYDPNEIESKTQYFHTQEEAAAWITEDPRHYHRVVLPFGEGHPISARLKDDKIFGGEKLIINAFGRTGLSPRAIKGHHAVSTDYEDWFDITLYIGDYYTDPMFDRGLTWIRLVKPDSPTLTFLLLPGDHKVEELNIRFSQVAQASIKVFQDLLKGMPLTEADF